LTGIIVSFCRRYAVPVVFGELVRKYWRGDPASTLIIVRDVIPASGLSMLVLSQTCHVTAEAAITRTPVIKRRITAAVRVLELWTPIIFKETYQDNLIYSFR
jgi:hypothetical protein